MYGSMDGAYDELPAAERRVITTHSMSSKKYDHHSEKHTDYGDIIRDVIIGFADGLTVPFALTAGLSSLGSARLVIIGGASPSSPKPHHHL
jgi:hypothetical protein